jgi:2-C-methyl-D-erythritol 4-phosphate cytidylyltransferase
VDADGVVQQTVDRDGYRLVLSPQAYRVAALLEALGTTDLPDGPEALVRAVQGRGGTVLSVPVPTESFRIAGADDLLLAEAMLQGQGSR